jgi:hypothetical protein
MAVSPWRTERERKSEDLGGAMSIKIPVWDIRREGRRWSHEEFDERTSVAPEKIEYVDGIFASERQRLLVPGMLLENIGIDKVVLFGRLEDWKAAIADLEKLQGSGSPS